MYNPTANSMPLISSRAPRIRNAMPVYVRPLKHHEIALSYAHQKEACCTIMMSIQSPVTIKVLAKSVLINYKHGFMFVMDMGAW